MKKTLVAIILALGLGFAAAYVLVTQQRNAEIAKLKQTPPAPAPAAPAPAPVEKVITVSAPAAGQESPPDILNDLINIKFGAGEDRNLGLRMVVFKLESLVQCGPSAVPAIRQFIGRNMDVDYDQQNAGNQNNQVQGNVAVINGGTDQATNNNGGIRGFNRGGGLMGGVVGGGFGVRGAARRARDLQNLQTDWLVPPSLRLGLIATLKEIGGPDAEQALAEMLNSTGRGVEVAYLTVALESMVPGKYRNSAVASAKALLANPPTVDNPDQLDALSVSYLYGVLEFYKDTSFAGTAGQLLVGANGRLDRDALDYLTTVLQAQSASQLYAAYQNSNLTNQFDRSTLEREILNYVGENTQANQLFTASLNNPDVSTREKIVSLADLASGLGGNAPADPQLISGRIAYLQSIESQYASDPQLSQAIPLIIGAMQNGQPISLRDLLNNGQGGGRRNRGGGQNNGNAGGNTIAPYAGGN